MGAKVAQEETDTSAPSQQTTAELVSKKQIRQTKGTGIEK
jgi:hypothetical protein